MGDWASAHLGDVVDVIMGQSPSSETYNDLRDGLPLIQGAADLGAYTPKPQRFTSAPTKVSAPGDTLISVRAPVGLANWANGQFCLGRGVAALRARAGINEKFLYYLTYLMNEHWQQQATGTTFPGIGGDTIRNTPIVIPPLREQREIASILGALDDKIELNRRMNATLEAMARALFQSWFVDFDPVRAKAEGRQPVGMDAETAALFPDSFEDSALGPIPKGWKVTTLGHLIGVLNGFAFKSQDWKESGVRVVKIGSVKPGYMDLNEGSFVSEEMASATARFALQAGDILIGMTGYVGEVGIMYDRSASPLLNQRVGKFQFNRVNGWTMEASYALLRHPRFKQFVVDRSVGSAQANVSSNAVLEYPVVNATEQVILSFGQVITPLVRQLIANYQEVDQCRKHRDTLLPKLLSGELRVGEVAA